ncbi:hypothetical protein N3K66_002742 [Trichothecium roseum]|uniref:Uncharacterized protein n=1 Tax=Trichothecium roseum TaxID=47278 RepID=A0ACC0VC22_9HYPO|nr:hypothetical protein N3K66_002742 [Trichothecium roseum]
MSTKRSHDQVEDAGPSDRSGRPTFKKQKFGTKAKHRAKEGSIEYSKKRIRNIERLFQRNADLPSDVRNDLERELATHKATVSDKGFQKRRSALISKYHMVRFFERKKAMRLVKQLKRKIEGAQDPAETEQLQQHLHIAQVDEAYTVHHPHAEPYISLYGGSKSTDKDDEDDDDAESKTPKAKAMLEDERPPMWKTVEQAMEQGPEALRALRERRTADEGSAVTTQRAKKPKTSVVAQPAPAEKKQAVSTPKPTPAPKQAKDGKQVMNRRERRKLMREAQDEEKEDDGEGFFDM